MRGWDSRGGSAEFTRLPSRAVALPLGTSTALAEGSDSDREADAVPLIEGDIRGALLSLECRTACDDEVGRPR